MDRSCSRSPAALFGTRRSRSASRSRASTTREAAPSGRSGCLASPSPFAARAIGSAASAVPARGRARAGGIELLFTLAVRDAGPSPRRHGGDRAALLRRNRALLLSTSPRKPACPRAILIVAAGSCSSEPGGRACEVDRARVRAHRCGRFSRPPTSYPLSLEHRRPPALRLHARRGRPHRRSLLLVTRRRIPLGVGARSPRPSPLGCRISASSRALPRAASRSSHLSSRPIALGAPSRRSCSAGTSSSSAPLGGAASCRGHCPDRDLR